MGSIHTVPVADLIDHPLTADCPCGPDCYPVQHLTGVDVQYVHHSLDGREFTEPDYTGPPKQAGLDG